MYNPFELIFVKGIRSESRFIFVLHVDVQLFEHHLLKDHLYSVVCSFLNDQVTIFMWVCFWDVCLVPLTYYLVNTSLP
jgi:hypothetical protein